MKTHVAFLAFLCFWLVALGNSGCTVQTVPVTPPQPHGGTCESAFENAKKLGGCRMHLDTLLQDCKDEESRSGVPLPHDCVTEAKDCETFLACS